MAYGVEIFASGAQHAERNTARIAHNVANKDSVGFWEVLGGSKSLFSVTRRAPAADANGNIASGLYQGLGTTDAGTSLRTTQGQIKKTDNDLDLAIEGNGGFVVEDADGNLFFTRNGTFKLSPEGLLVTQEGLTVSPGITFSPNAIEKIVTPAGEVFERTSAANAPVKIGDLAIARAADLSSLRPDSNTIYQPTVDSGELVIGTPGTDGAGLVKQGFVEDANVVLIKLLIELIQTEKTHNANVRGIGIGDKMGDQANRILNG